MGTNASIWSVRDGRELTVYELAECMGHRMSNAYYDDVPMSEPAFRSRLGLSVHVAVSGTMMMLLLASTQP